MQALETITISTVAKKSNLSRKAILKAIEELGVVVFYMRMKAYGIYRGHVRQIKCEDVERVTAKAVEYKEEPKQPKRSRVSKVEQLKANGFEILKETKTLYRLSKDGITRSVGKYESITKILGKFETLAKAKKEEAKKEEVKEEEVKEEEVKEATPIEVTDSSVIPADGRGAADALEAAMKSGKLSVKSAFLDGDEIREYEYSFEEILEHLD